MLSTLPQQATRQRTCPGDSIWLRTRWVYVSVVAALESVESYQCHGNRVTSNENRRETQHPAYRGEELKRKPFAFICGGEGRDART